MLSVVCPNCSAALPLGAVAPAGPNYRGALFAQGRQVTCPQCKCLLEPKPWTLKLAILLTFLVTTVPLIILAGYLKTWSNRISPPPNVNWPTILAAPVFLVLVVLLRSVVNALIFPRVVRLRATYNPQDPLGGGIH